VCGRTACTVRWGELEKEPAKAGDHGGPRETEGAEPGIAYGPVTSQAPYPTILTVACPLRMDILRSDPRTASWRSSDPLRSGASPPTSSSTTKLVLHRN